MVGATPLALGYSLYARAHAANRPLTYVALVLAGLAALFLTLGVVMSLLARA